MGKTQSQQEAKEPRGAEVQSKKTQIHRGGRNPGRNREKPQKNRAINPENPEKNREERENRANKK